MLVGPSALFFGLIRLFGAGLAGRLCLLCLLGLGLPAPLCRGFFLCRGGLGLGLAAPLGRSFLFRRRGCLGLAGALCRGLLLCLFGLGGLRGLLGCGLFGLGLSLVLRRLAGALGRHLKVEHAHGGQRDGDALLEAVERLLLGADSLVVDAAGAAERLVVAVQDLLVGAGVRCAQRIALAQDGVEVADHEDLLAAGVLAQEGHDALP